MPPRRISAFFYGLFMDVDLLRGRGRRAREADDQRRSEENGRTGHRHSVGGCMNLHTAVAMAGTLVAAGTSTVDSLLRRAVVIIPP